MIYFVVFILLLIPVVKYDWMAKTGGESKWYYFNLVVLILLAGLRYRVGGDTLMYMSVYDSFPKWDELKYFDFETAEYQPLWYVFTAICRTIYDDFTFFQLVHASIITSVFFYCFRKYCPNYYFSAILLYYVGYYCYFSMEIMREVLCIALLMLSTTWLLEKKWLRYYLVCVVAIFFHYSALVMLLFPFAVWLFKRPSWIFQLICLVVIFIALNVVNIPAYVISRLPIDGQLSRMILAYIENQVSIGGMLFQLLSFLPVLGVIFVRQRISVIEDEYDFTPIVMASVFVYAFSMSIAGFSRFINYFVLYIIIYMVNTTYKVLYLKAKDIQLTFVGLLATLFVYGFNLSYYYVRDMSEFYPNTRYYTIFYPYSSVFDKKVDNKRECFIENYREVQIMF